MKKILPVIIAVIITAMVSVGITYFIMSDNTDKESDKKESSSSENIENTGYSLEVINESVFGSSSQNNFEIKSVVIDKGDEGEDVALITIKYTRLSGDAASIADEAIYNCSTIAYQNGVSLETYYSDSMTKKYNINSSRFDKVMAGYSTEVVLMFELKDRNTDLLVEIKEGMFEDDVNYIVSKTFKMK